MVYRRKIAKKAYRPKRKVVRKVALKRAVKDNLCYISRRYSYGTVSGSVTAGWNTATFNFALGNLPNAGELTSVFEQYKINAVKLTFIPNFTGADATGASGGMYLMQPRVYKLIDKDGFQAARLVTESAMLENSAVRLVNNPMRTFSIYCSKPCAQFEVASTIGFAQAAPKPSPWLDCENYAVQHSGIALGIAAVGASSAVFQYQVIATYYMAFKGAQ